MRLNPTKYMFGVEVGKFLGFMISQIEIKANPEKKNKGYTGDDVTEVCERNLTSYRSDCNVKTLFLYLTTSHEALTAVLVKEEENLQKPVYYISKILQALEKKFF